MMITHTYTRTRVEPLFVSFYTPKYSGEALQLEASLSKLDLPYYIEPRPELGGWHQNVCQKPQFLFDVLTERCAGRDVVWVDADARVMEQPYLLYDLACDDDPRDVDVAVHYRTDELGLRLGDPEEGELLAGTIFLRNCPPVLELLGDWVRLNREDTTGVWPQKHLQRLLKEDYTDLYVFKLPATYCMIVTGGGRVQMGDWDDAVIAHTQASRRFR